MTDPDLSRRTFAGHRDARTDRILKGADANTLPIEQVSRIGLTLNVATARSIGFTVPPAILARVDRLIE
jgi:putative ABC transport system substrate-binding protein